jgi:hypothetical protein
MPPTAQTTALDLGPRLSGPRVFNAKSRERFMRRRYRELAIHIGHPPSATERVLLERIVRLQWMLLRMDQRIEEEGLGELSGHAQRAMLAAENRLRCDIALLGLKAATEVKPLSLAELLKAERARRKFAALLDLSGPLAAFGPTR